MPGGKEPNIRPKTILAGRAVAGAELLGVLTMLLGVLLGAVRGRHRAASRHTQCLMRDLHGPPKHLARWYHRSGDYSGDYCKACRGPGPRTLGG